MRLLCKNRYIFLKDKKQLSNYENLTIFEVSVKLKTLTSRKQINFLNNLESKLEY